MPSTTATDPLLTSSAVGTVSAIIMLISVVIPTYNRAALVGRAIGSALAQTLTDLEVIVVDDASTDATAEVVREIRDPRLRLLALLRHGGVGRARNVGIQASRGEWVAFLDSDDEWLRRKLELQIDRWQRVEDPRVTVLYGAVYYRQDLTGHTVLRPRSFFEGDVLDWAIGERLDITTPTVLVQRQALLAVGGFPEGLQRGEDTELWARLAVAENHFAAVREPVAIIHRHLGPHLYSDPAPRADASEMLANAWRWAAHRRRLRASGGGMPSRNVQRAYFAYKRLREAIESRDHCTVWRRCLDLVGFATELPGFVIRAFVLVTCGPRAYSRLAAARSVFSRRDRSLSLTDVPPPTT